MVYHASKCVNRKRDLKVIVMKTYDPMDYMIPLNGFSLTEKTQVTANRQMK